jgi:hypothetical protein
METLVLKHFGSVPEDWELFKTRVAQALYLEELENERLKALFGENG